MVVSTRLLENGLNPDSVSMKFITAWLKGKGEQDGK